MRLAPSPLSRALRAVSAGYGSSFKRCVSWDDAQQEAKRWIDGLNVQGVKGTLVDLRGPAQLLPFQGHFRTMVFQAAKRLLKKRGAAVILPDDA
jgi:hypothetical protein